MPRENQFSLESDKNNGTDGADRHDAAVVISGYIPLRIRNVSDKVCRENQTHILCSVTPPAPKILPLRDNVGKHCTAGQATDDNMAHAHCVVDN